MVLQAANTNKTTEALVSLTQTKSVSDRVLMCLLLSLCYSRLFFLYCEWMLCCMVYPMQMVGLALTQFMLLGCLL